MPLSQLDRMSAIMLAKTIATGSEMLAIKGEIGSYLRRLHRYKLFTVTELAEIAELSEYKVKQYIIGEEQFVARTGVRVRHLDHLLRMVGSRKFAKIHVKALIEDGATIAGLSRVSGISESSLRRWAEEE